MGESVYKFIAEREKLEPIPQSFSEARLPFDSQWELELKQHGQGCPKRKKQVTHWLCFLKNLM